MPSVYDVKPKFQALLRPAVGALARAGVTANQVTVFAALLSALASSLPEGVVAPWVLSRVHRAAGERGRCWSRRPATRAGCFSFPPCFRSAWR